MKIKSVLGLSLRETFVLLEALGAVERRAHGYGFVSDPVLGIARKLAVSEGAARRVLIAVGFPEEGEGRDE